MSVFCFHK